MSTHASTTTDSTPTTPTLTTGRWQSEAEPAPASSRAPLTFDARCRYRIPNGMDAENQYDGRGRTRR